MKKIGILIALVCYLFGCQSQTEITDFEESKAYTYQDELEFELIKTEVTEQIAPSNKNKTYKYIEPSQDNYVFIDMVVKTINLSKKEKRLEDIFAGHFEVNRESYEMKQVVETINYNQMSTTDTIKTNETRYIHLYCEVPNDQIKEEATIIFKVLNQYDFQYTFLTEQHVMNNDTKSLGDILTLQQSQIALNNILKTDKVEPSNKGFFYSYIPTDHDDETFVILQVDIKNTSDISLDPNEYLYCEYLVDNQQIKSKIIIESENHKSLSQTDQIKSLETRTLYLAMSVKNNLLKQKGIIHLFVEGNTFEIQI